MKSYDKSLGNRESNKGILNSSNQKKGYRKPGREVLILLILMLITIASTGIVAGCSSSTKKSGLIPGSSILPIASRASNSTEKKNSNENKMTGILTYLSTESYKMHFVETDTGNEYEVDFSGGTDIKNRYGSIISTGRMSIGGIYDLTYNKSGKAVSIYESDKYWQNSDVTDLGVNEPSHVITIGSSNYQYTDNIIIISNGQRIKATEIMIQDTVTIHGNGKTIYSINVDSGHGYVKFTGCSAFLGGYLDISTRMVLTVTEGMVVTAPEGTYKVAMQLGDVTGTKTITVKRNENITVDFSEYKPVAVQMGTVLFSVTPAGAVMYIDGKQVSYSDVMSLSYGNHTLVLKANNYATYTEAFVVKQTYEKKIIDMASSSTTSTKSSSTSTVAANLTSGYVVNVKAPAGAAVYVDSVYIGIAPVSFNKTAGNRVITLTKAGSATKSYTIAIANATGDLNYSFPDMETETTTTTAATTK